MISCPECNKYWLSDYHMFSREENGMVYGHAYCDGCEETYRLIDVLGIEDVRDETKHPL